MPQEPVFTCQTTIHPPPSMKPKQSWPSSFFLWVSFWREDAHLEGTYIAVFDTPYVDGSLLSFGKRRRLETGGWRPRLGLAWREILQHGIMKGNVFRIKAFEEGRVKRLVNGSSWGRHAARSVETERRFFFRDQAGIHDLRTEPFPSSQPVER